MDDSVKEAMARRLVDLLDSYISLYYGWTMDPVRRRKPDWGPDVLFDLFGDLEVRIKHHNGEWTKRSRPKWNYAWKMPGEIPAYLDRISHYGENQLALRGKQGVVRTGKIRRGKMGERDGRGERIH